jgi:hypothetical protein
MLKILKTATLPHSRRDFLGLAFSAQQLRRQLPCRACRPTRKDRSKYVLSGGEAAQGVAAESRGSGNKANDAPTTAAGCYQRNRTTPDADIATAALADRRVPLVHQHTNSITSDEHEAAIHSEDLTRDLARARARKGEGDFPN